MNWTVFENKLKKRMETDHVPGCAIAVSKKGKMIYQKGFGVKNLESGDSVTPKTIFGIASVTKSFTALAIMKLEEEGLLSIHDPVIDYLPELQISCIQPIDSIKIHHLLTHSTGLAPIRRREELNDFHQHLNYLAETNHDILGMPGEFISYCNDTFLLLGAIIERLTGRLFRRYMTEEILAPLHLHRSTFSIEELQKLEDVSTPYVFNEEKRDYEIHPWPPLGNYEVGGGIRSNVVDLLKYGELFLNQVPPIITKKQLDKMWKPYMPLSTTSYYGYALEVTPNYHGMTLVEHGGGQPGVSSHFGFIPEQDLVVAILTNVSDASVKDIWIEAVNTALNLPIEERRTTYPSIELSQEQQRRFLGTYQSEEGTCLQINLDTQGLKANIENKEFLLYASDEKTLIIADIHRPIRFHMNPEGIPWAAFFGLRMLLKQSVS
ncbi:serine hydrolase domain-containing protein [Heyndrickxia sp. FSL K6-6286]|uniref:serine hydrolase domain-containing protein n=1 Tax=Heyndrickxia sp. FSL K6-6286 TaxID=2921510 RepID=UPI00315A145D